MKQRAKQPALPAGLESIQRRFERWRETREGRSRISESLWALATRAARQFGVHRTCRALRLDYVVLKRHVEADAPQGSPRHDPPRALSSWYLLGARLRRSAWWSSKIRPGHG